MNIHTRWYRDSSTLTTRSDYVGQKTNIRSRILRDYATNSNGHTFQARTGETTAVTKR